MAKTQTADQHSQALRQLEQLNLLRESNVMLRNENERSFGRIRELQAQVIFFANVIAATSFILRCICLVTVSTMLLQF